jgi:hypothetical protein
MTPKQKLRAKKNLKQRLRRAGACVTCGPMLKFPEPPADSKATIHVECISCARAISFDYDPSNPLADEAMDTLERSFVTAAGICPHSMTRIVNDKTCRDDPECSCGNDRAVFQFIITGKD